MERGLRSYRAHHHVSPLRRCSGPDANRPKVVLTFTDDQAYGDVGAYGATGYSTPNLDTMADEGILFSNDVGNKRYGRSEWARAPGADSSFVSPLTQLMRNEEIVESGPDQTQLTRRYTEEAEAAFEEIKLQ